MRLFSSIASDDDRMRDVAIDRTSTSALSSLKIVNKKRFKQLKALLRLDLSDELCDAATYALGRLDLIKGKVQACRQTAIKPKPRIRPDLLDSRLLFTLDFASPDGATTTQALDRAGVFAWLRDEDDPVPPRPVIDELGSHDDRKSVESATTGAQDTEDFRSAASSSSVLGTVQQNLSSGTNPSVVDLKLRLSSSNSTLRLPTTQVTIAPSTPLANKRLLFRKVGDRKPKIVVNQNRQLSRDEIRPGFHYVQGEPNQQYSADRALALSINVVEEQSEDGLSGSHCVTFQLENLDKVACPNQYWFLLDIELGNPVYPDGLPDSDTNLVFTPFTLGLRDRPKAVISDRSNQWTALEGTITSPDATKVVTFDDQYHPEMVLLSNDQREFGITHMFNVWRSPYE